MNYNEILAQFLQKTLSGVETTINFLSTEIPEVIQQLLIWKFAESIIYCLLGILAIISWYFYEHHLWKWLKKEDNDDLYGFVGVIGGSIPRVFFAVFIAVYINLTWLQIWLSPKLYLLEYAATLLKGK